MNSYMLGILFNVSSSVFLFFPFKTLTDACDKVPRQLGDGQLEEYLYDGCISLENTPYKFNNCDSMAIISQGGLFLFSLSRTESC
jgi:hypothetical protein